MIATYQHNDSDDVFEREPYSVQFRTRAGNEGTDSRVSDCMTYSVGILLLQQACDHMPKIHQSH